jgi:putative CRISPR-associated protein (TIGR02619 family)
VKLREKYNIANKEDVKLFLCSTDTPDGALCAHVLDKFLKENEDLPFGNVQAIKIPALQVAEMEPFITTGLKKLRKEIYAKIDKYSDDKVKIIISITGGYKAVIPCLTMLALERLCDLVYISSEKDGGKGKLIEMKYDENEGKWNFISDENISEPYPYLGG